MKTKYNLDLDIEERDLTVPRDLYFLSVACFKREGLLGEFKVDESGRLRNGFDPTCGIIREAKFDIFYRERIDKSFREQLDTLRVLVSGFNESELRLLDHAETCLEVLERYEPLSTLPVNLYSNFSLIKSREINTPAGIQALTAYALSGGLVRLIRPKEDEFIWDLDTLLTQLFEEIMAFPLPNEKKSFRGIFGSLIKSRSYKKHSELYSCLMKNPDSIKRIRL